MRRVKYSLGLDIGTSSVGWALIDEENDRIIDIGVRIFEKPEDPQNGNSLALSRRIARGGRRRLLRRRVRLNHLKDFFVRENLLSRSDISRILIAENIGNYNDFDPWEIRVRALDKKVSNEELFRALYHIAKRRGYKSNRKSEKDDKKTSGVLFAISANSLLLEKNGGEYRTVGEAVFRDKKFIDQKRNKRDSFDSSFYRTDYEDEFRKILNVQGFSDKKIRQLFDGEERDFYEDKVLATGVFAQRPFTNKFLINRMRGEGEFGGKRAPKSSASFEIFRASQELRNLRLISDIDQKSRTLTADEIKCVINSGLKTEKITYSKIREAIQLDANFSFIYLRGKLLDMRNFDITNPDKKMAENAKKLDKEYQKKNRQNNDFAQVFFA